MRLFLILILTAATFSKPHAQGCVAVRQMGGVNAMCSASSYNLSKGDFQVGANTGTLIPGVIL